MNSQSTHKDEKQIFYDLASSNRSTNGSIIRSNWTDLNYNAPVKFAWIGPYIVPLTDYNAGWSVYQVDPKTWEIVNGQVYFANISNSLNWSPEPEWEFEYDARSTYDPEGQWPKTAPLNATFWHWVTTKMESNSSLIERYNFLQTKQSVLTPSCKGSCLVESICEIRSSNAVTYEACTA
jgi:sphingomyelin phosphodiesterase